MIGQHETIISDAPCCVYQGTTLVVPICTQQICHPDRSAKEPAASGGLSAQRRDLGVGLRQSGRSREPSDFFFDQPGDPDQDDGAEYRYQDGPEQAATTKADQANHPSANDSTNDSQRDVGDHAVSAALHDFPGCPAGDETHDDPPDNPVYHVILLRSVRDILQQLLRWLTSKDCGGEIAGRFGSHSGLAAYF